MEMKPVDKFEAVFGGALFVVGAGLYGGYPLALMAFGVSVLLTGLFYR